MHGGGELLDQLVEVLVPEATALPTWSPSTHIGTINFSTARKASSSGMLVSVTRRMRCFEDLRVVRFGEVTVLGEVLVTVVRDQTEERLLQVGTGGRDAVDEAFADGRREGDA
jgi:hypothetical protein